MFVRLEWGAPFSLTPWKSIGFSWRADESSWASCTCGGNREALWVCSYELTLYGGYTDIRSSPSNFFSAIKLVLASFYTFWGRWPLWVFSLLSIWNYRFSPVGSWIYLCSILLLRGPFSRDSRFDSGFEDFLEPSTALFRWNFTCFLPFGDWPKEEPDDEPRRAAELLEPIVLLPPFSEMDFWSYSYSCFDTPLRRSSLM